MEVAAGRRWSLPGRRPPAFRGRLGEKAGISFVPTDRVRTAAERAGLPPSEVDAIADSYASARLNGLQAAILATGGITLAAFLVTAQLPSGRTDRTKPPGTDRPEPPGTDRPEPPGTGAPAVARRASLDALGR